MTNSFLQQQGKNVNIALIVHAFQIGVAGLNIFVL